MKTSRSCMFGIVATGLLTAGCYGQPGSVAAAEDLSPLSADSASFGSLSGVTRGPGGKADRRQLVDLGVTHGR